MDERIVIRLADVRRAREAGGRGEPPPKRRLHRRAVRDGRCVDKDEIGMARRLRMKGVAEGRRRHAHREARHHGLPHRIKAQPRLPRRVSQLGVGAAIVAWFDGGLDGGRLVALTFGVTAAVAFSTGTSWGAFALMMPVALPVALDNAGGPMTPLVFQTVAAVAGGGIFGDHASPVSDTTVLASVGAGSDHMDHVVTQLPYALAGALLTIAAYLLLPA